MSTPEDRAETAEALEQEGGSVEAAADGSVATMDESGDEPGERSEEEPQAVAVEELPPEVAERAGELEAVAAEGSEPDQAVAEEELPHADEAEEAEELPPLDDEARLALGQALFALLFASPDTLSLGRLKDLTESPTAHVREGLAEVERLVEESALPLVLRHIAGGYRLFSAPEVAGVVARLAKVRKAEQVTPAALETLSIVAYRQPVTKAEVEAIRGVQAGPMLRQLIDRGLVKVAGRADQPGSPLLYATTREFLDRFGLARLKDLPRDAELK